jgi:hypothetical protein
VFPQSRIFGNLTWFKCARKGVRTDAKAKERARIRRVLRRLDEDAIHWEGSSPAVSGISDSEVKIALALIRGEIATMEAKLAEIEGA